MIYLVFYYTTPWSITIKVWYELPKWSGIHLEDEGDKSKKKENFKRQKKKKKEKRDFNF